ncbi:MAG: DUF2080 family transposase-associated protein [Pseudomonadota bacterium]
MIAKECYGCRRHEETLIEQLSESQKLKRTASEKDIKTVQDFQRKIRFEIWGEEVIQKQVKASANSGRVYLPPGWVGHKVKIVRMD